MFHTEGYADGQTYSAKGHVFCFAMEQRACVCYVWCIIKENPADTEQVERMLKEWAGRELAACLEMGKVAMQREVNRFGEKLKLQWSGKDNISPVLWVYWKGNVFSWGEEKTSFWRFQKSFGVCLSSEVGKVPEIGEYPEETANFLKRAILKAMSDGKLERGYFLIWEDSENV